MNKILKKGIFALIIVMIVSAVSSLAINTKVINPIDIEETFETETLTGWTAAGGADCYADDAGRLAMKLTGYGENSQTVTKKIDNANLNVFVNFDFLMLNKNGKVEIRLKNENGETFSTIYITAENGINWIDGKYISVGGWNSYNSSIRFGIGDYTNAVNNQIIYAKQKLDVESTALSAIEFTADAPVDLYIDNFSVSNVRPTNRDQSSYSAAVRSGVFNVTPMWSYEGTHEYGFIEGSLQNNVMEVNIPAITDYGVIELDGLWIGGSGQPVIPFGFGQGGGSNGVIWYNNAPWYNTSSGWQPSDLSWTTNSHFGMRIEVDVTNKKWHAYAMDSKSNGEYTYRASFDLAADTEYIDYLAIDCLQSYSQCFFGNVKVTGNTGVELDDKSIMAFAPSSDDATLVVASYTGERLVDVKLIEMSNPCIKTFEELGLNTADAAAVKAFMLDGTDNITPLGKAEWKTLHEKSLSRPSENTEDNIIMFIGSKEVYVSNIPETLSTPIYTKNNTVMYPIEQVCKGTGSEYSHDDGTINIVTPDGKKAIIWIDATRCLIDGTNVELPVPAEKINGEIFVPEKILKDVGLKIFKTTEGLIAVSGNTNTLINTKNAQPEINYLTSIYTADEIAEDAVQIYVAPNGNDSAAGRIDSPLRTFEGAQRKVRKSKEGGMTKDIVVNFRGGTYYMDSTVEMQAQDSGINGHRVIYRKFEDENVEFTFGEKLKWEDFTKVSDTAVLSRFDSGVRDKIMQIDLKEYGLMEYGLIFPRLYGSTLYAPMELYINSKAQTVARYPNEGFIDCASVVKAGSKFAATGGDGTLNNPAIISFTENEPLTWQDSDDIYLYGQWDYGWVTNEQKPLIDKAKKQMTLKYMSFGVNRASGTRYYYKNVLEELDIPGEYYIDRSTGILYLYPNGDISNSEIVVTKMLDNTKIDEWELALNVASSGKSGVPQNEVDAANAKYTMVSFNDASHITLDGLNFKYTAGNAVTIKDGYNLMIKNCDISCAGIRAIDINGGYDHVVKNCHMQELGGGGVNIVNAGDRTTLTSSGIKVENCEILDYDLLTGGYAGAVYISGVGVTVRNNRMAGSKHFAVGFYGNDHVIQNNDISDVLQVSDDAGAIYSFNDISYWNNNISYNYFHDTKRAFHFSNAEGEAGLTHNLVAAIYLDNYISGNKCVGNLAENFGSYMTFVHGGGINDISNNVYVSTGDKSMETGIIKVVSSGDPVPSGTKNNSATYRERYPDMAQAIDGNYLGAPTHNNINGNIVYAKKTRSSIFGSVYASKISFDIYNDSTNINSGNLIRNSYSEEAPFVNISEQDYRLASASDFANTFGNIDNATDYANMGLTEDYPFANRDEDIKRLFIKSDKFNSGVANYNAAKGETIQLEVIARGESGYVLDLDDVRYASSNSNIATVNSDGLVTVNTDGEARITATAIKNGKIKTIYININ